MTRKVFIILFILFFAGLICGTLFDLRISQMLYDPESWAGNVVNYMAMIPSAIMLMYCSGVVVWYCRNHRFRYVAATVIINFIGSILVFGEIGEWAHLSLKMWLPLALVASLLVLLMFQIIKPNVTKDMFVLAMTFMITIVAVMLTVEGLKYLFGRPRFYSLTDPATQFVPWYLPHPFATSDYCKSFPSGHTAFASLTVFLIYLPDMLKKNGNWKLFIFAYLLWTGFVMYGRICYGAHFLSDVSAGALIALCICYYAHKIVEKHTDFDKI